jgi:oligopeptide transport system substrate-binding protein
MLRRLTALCVAAVIGMGAASAVTLTRGNMAEPDTLDPHKYTLSAERYIHTDLFEGLVGVDAKGEPIPGLADSWSVSEDGKVWTFRMRPGLKWSDGVDLTADDVVAGFRRAVDPVTAAPVVDEAFFILNGREVASGTKKPEDLGVRAVDAVTVEIALVAPSAILPVRLAGVPLFAPLPRHVFDKAGQGWVKAGTMVTSGPYVLAEWVPSSFVRVVKNPNYWDAANVKIDEVVFMPTEDEATGMKLFRAGELDLTLGFPPGQYEWLKANMAAETRLDPAAVVTYLTFNQVKPPFNDARVRRALSLAIDREVITGRVLNIGLTPAYSFVPSKTAGWTPAAGTDFSTRAIAERQAEARALLEAAGFGASNPLSFRLDYRGTDANKRVVVAISAMWAKIGVKANLQANEIKAHYAKLREGDYEVADGNWTGGPAPELFMNLVATNAEINWSKWSNPEFDRLVNEASAALDPAVRSSLFQQADAIVAAEAPIAPVYFNSHRILVQQWVKGFEGNPNNLHPSRFMSVER